MPRLTTNFINTKVTLADAGRTAFYRDDEVTGFALKVTHCSMTYVAECRVQGTSRRVTIGRHPLLTPEEARKQARVILGKMSAGIDPRQREVRNITLRQAFEEYMDSRPMRPNTVYSFNRIMHKELADWLDLPVTKITRHMVLERFRQLSENRTKGANGHAAANLCMHVLRACLYYVSFKYAEGNEPLIPMNPVVVLGQLRLWHKLPPKQGTIPDHKLQSWYQAVMSLGNPTARDYFMVLILTGLRRNEAARLEWRDIDLEAKTLRVRPEINKNKKEHRLPLSDYLYDLLKRRHEENQGSPYVFPGYRRKGRYHGCYRTVKQLRQVSGCDFIIHDCRRTFLTQAERLDTPHYALRKLAGHANGQDITAPYLVIDLERLRPIMQKITDKFLELMGVKSPFLTAGLEEQEDLVTASGVKTQSGTVIEEEPEAVYW